MRPRISASTSELRAHLKALRETGKKRRLQQPIMLMRMLEAFCAEHPQLSRRRDHMDYFWVHLMNERYPNGKKVRRASTVAAYRLCARKYGIRADRMKRAWRRIHERALGTSIDLAALDETPLTKYEILQREAVRRPIYHPAIQKEARAGIFLMLATGCRAEHLNRIAKVDCTREGVLVTWQQRKILGALRRPLLYPYSWSCTPPADVIPILRRWPDARRSFSDAGPGRTVAANRVNRCIKLCKESGDPHFTSSYYRRRMSTILSQKVHAGELRKEIFRFLLDHRYETSFMRYVLPGEVEQLLYAA